MVIDHIGAVMLPQYPILRIIGRIAFPIFAYQLTVGYEHTSDVRRYEWRLLLFAIIAQLPFTLYFATSGASVMVTLLVSLLVMDQVTKRRWYALLLVVLVPYLTHNDYGAFGILLPLIFHWMRRQ